MAKKRSFKKLREHLTSNEVDKKISYLESRMPTNNTAFVFGGDPGNPQGNSFETIVDGETDSTDYTVGENPTNSTEARDTSGLFTTGGDHSKGEYVKTEEPPGDTSYILGPMAAMYYTWAYPWTMIGYIRESDRKMVNLGRIDGKFSDWNGSVGNANSGSGTFYSYGQLTTEQALWFYNIAKANGNTNDPATYSYRAFYPGPPSASPDAYGRYPCILTGVSKRTPRSVPDSTPLDKQAGDNFSAQNARNKRGIGARGGEGERGGLLGWLGGAMDNIRNSLSNAVPAALGRALRSLTDPLRYAGELMFQGNPAGRGAGLSNYWSPNPITAGGYTGQGGGFPGRGPTASGTITSAPRPVNTPRVSRSPLGQPQFKFPKGTSVSNMVTQSADNAAVSALGRRAASTMGRRLGRVVPFVGAGIAVADATSRIRNGDFGGAVLSGLSAIPGPIGWMALGTQMVTDGIGATGNRREEYIIETKTKDTFRDELQKMGGFDIEKGDWGAAFMDELAKTNEIKDDEKAIIAAVFNGDDEGLMITDLQETLGKIMARIANKEYEGKKPEVQEKISLERKREIFGHLTKPVILPETKQKTYKVSPGQRFKDKNKKPEETNFQDMDKLFNKNIGGPQPFKPQERTSWTKDFIRQNTMQSQEKMNGVLEMIGDGKHAFDYATNEYKKMGVKELEQYWGKNPNMYSFLFNGKKYNVTRKEHIENDSIVFMEDQKGVKSNMLQSVLNDKLQEQNEKWIREAYFKSHPVIPEKKESTYELIKRRFLENKKIAPEFPEKEPPKMINGFHPEYGKRSNRYKKLDPASANAMPLTGDPETDEIVRKQKTINKIKSMKKKA